MNADKTQWNLVGAGRKHKDSKLAMITEDQPVEKDSNVSTGRGNKRKKPSSKKNSDPANDQFLMKSKVSNKVLPL